MPSRHAGRMIDRTRTGIFVCHRRTSHLLPSFKSILFACSLYSRLRLQLQRRDRPENIDRFSIVKPVLDLPNDGKFVPSIADGVGIIYSLQAALARPIRNEG